MATALTDSRAAAEQHERAARAKPLRLGSSRRLGQVLLICGLMALLLAVQYGQFRAYVLREIAWAYPDHYDQAGYLGQSYTLYEQIRSEGLWAALWPYLDAARPTGLLFPAEGSLFMLVLGPSRLSALTVHFAHFALLQGVLFGTLYWLTRRLSVACIGIGLLLAAVAPFIPGGGMFDYRIDYSAYCLFGVAVCLVVRSRLFVSGWWSAAAGAVASLMVLCRFLTTAYLAGIVALFVLFLCLRWLRAGTDEAVRRLVRRQGRGLLSAACVLGVIAGPAVWHNRMALYGYYVVGHVTGREKQIYAMGAGIKDACDALTYYPYTLCSQHLGTSFVVLAGSLLAGAVVLWLVGRRAPVAAAPDAALDWPGLWVFLLVCFLVPLALLTWDPSKVSPVCGILIPPLLWLILLAVIALARVRLPHRSLLLSAGLPVLAAAALATGVATQALLYRQPSFFSRYRAGYQKVAEVYDVLEQHCREMGWTSPRVAATCIQTDHFQPVVILPYIYERHRVLIHPRSGKMAGNYLLEVTEAEVLDEVGRSDFVLLVDPAQAPSAYPFDGCIRAMFPRLKAFCDANLVPLRRFKIWHFDVVLYTRPADPDAPREKEAS